MSVALVVIIAMMLLAGIVIAFMSKNNSRSVPEEAIDFETLTDERVMEHLPEHKVQAIKVYRQLTGANLATSKRAVDYAIANPDALEGKKARTAADSLSDAGIRELVDAGRSDEAAELYRQFTGVDEYTAQDYIENLENEMRR